VARPTSSAEVAEVIAVAAAQGLTVLAQATGHGAGGEIGDDVLLLDTSGLVELTIDPEAQTASAGPGLTWGEINPQVEKFGLLGLSGSSPTVAIGGYTFGGGFGWLTRPHGAASAALRSVEYVDGSGRVRLASDSAMDEVDRDAVWAFRGGGGVGVATRLDFDLKPAPDLYAGYLLWPIDDLEAVTRAWTKALPHVGEAVGTSISVLHTPPTPPFPEDLQGVPVVHLAVASSRGEEQARYLLNAVRQAAAPAVDTWGPADAAKLATIHLDPPVAVPALGEARWLSSDTPAHAVEILSLARAADSPIALIEIRHFANDAPARNGAETVVPGPFALHAVGALVDLSAGPAIQAAFKELRDAAVEIDLGRSIGSWVEGASSVPDALTPEIRERVTRIADAVDPEGRIRRSRYVL